MSANPFVSRFRSAFMAGISAFKETYTSVNPENPVAFESYDARRARYGLYWALYENNAYRDVHAWARAYREIYALYKYVRNVYNPSYRLGEFWSTHLMGGTLDPAAGDGTERASVLPIEIDASPREADVRRAIGRLWRDSNWQTMKDVYTLYGAVLGDVALKVVDDMDKGRVYLEVVHPSKIADITRDAYGNVKGYVLEFERDDPEREGKRIPYTEIASRDGDAVVYETLRDGKPYAWNGVASAWSIPYTFVPFVVVQHHNVGLDWGFSEIHPVRAKMHEADDVASAISDHIRKSLNAPFLLSGVANPRARVDGTPNTVSVRGRDRDLDTTRAPGREELPFLYAPAGASATQLMANMDYTGALAHLSGILQEIEREYPELRFDNLRVMGDASGRALRIARQPAETKVEMRRAAYDDGLKRAMQMALAIGGMRAYDQYTPFSLASYDAGELEFTIGTRPVFREDDLERYETERALYENAEIAERANIPSDVVLERAGWDAQDLQKVEDAREKQIDLEARDIATQPEFNQEPLPFDGGNDAPSNTPQTTKGKSNG